MTYGLEAFDFIGFTSEADDISFISVAPNLCLIEIDRSVAVILLVCQLKCHEEKKSEKCSFAVVASHTHDSTFHIVQ